MTSIRLAPALTLLALTACYLSAVEGLPVPVTYGDFEAGAQGWENGPQITTAQKHGGNKALALTKGFVVQSLTAMIPIDAGNDYQLRVWVKTEGCKPKAAALCASFRSADGKNHIGGWVEGAKPEFVMDNGQSPVLAAFGGTADWSECVVSIPAGQIPAGAKWLLVYLRHDLQKEPTGTVYFDDLTAMMLPTGTVAAAAILKNGGFELGKVGWWGPGTWSVINEGAAVGKSALKIESGFACQDKRPVSGGQRYRVSMRVRSDGAPEGAVFVQSSYRGPGVEPTWYGPTNANGEPALLATGGTHEWKEFAVVVEAPSGAEEILLYLRKAEGTAGVAFYDEVIVEATAEPVTAAIIVPFTGEIIVNGDFEKGKSPWWGQGSWEVVSGQGVGGGAALRVDKGFACQDKRPVEGRKNYRISMQVRSDGCAENGVFVQTSYRHGQQPLGGWKGPLRWKKEAAVVVTGGTHDWKTFSIVVQAPTSATQLLLYLRKQDGPGSAWYDDVKVEPTDEKVITAADRRAAELATELLSPAMPEADAASRIAAALALGNQPTAEKLMLAANGKATIHLHVASQTDVVTLGVAKELAGLLEQISGAAALPISHDAHPQAGPLLIIGRDNTLTGKLCADVDWTGLGEDGFIIRSVGTHLVISGGTSRGTMYGVYWFLDHVLGVRWLAPEITHVPSISSLSVPPQKVRQTPRFTYREVLSDEGSRAAFAAHNLMNGRSHGPSYSPTAPEIDNWDHSWMAAGGTDDFWDLLNKKETEKIHPEWFTGGQVAMMDKGMRAAMAKEVIARLRAHQDYTKIWYNIWQKDWGWDMDPASKAFADAHGGHASAPRLDMMIDIAEQVRAVLPGARLAFNAYTWGFTPPTGMTVPDHILVFPMTLHVDYKTPLYVGRNEQLAADMIGWTKIAKNVLVWDHIANWAGFLQPTPNIFPIGDSITWLAGIPGIFGYFCEGNWNSPGGEFSALRAWLIARMIWDPSLDPRRLTDEWCQLTYGKAGPQVRRYIDLMHEIAAKTDDVLGQRYMPDLPMYDLDFISAADALFDAAEAAVAGDPVLLARVHHARLPIDYLALIRRAEYMAAAAQRGLPWQVDTIKRRARFDQTLVDNKIRQYRQGGSVKELAAILDVERVPATAHPLVKDLPPGDWADVQDLAFMRFDHAAIVEDPAASDHAAIRTRGTNSVWSIQLPLGGIPKGGDWDLYAAVRVEAEAGHDSEPGVRVGSSPPMGLFNTATIGELNDGTYHLVKVPGGPHRWGPNNPLKSIYIQSPSKPYLTYIYLDRIVAVRHKP